MGTDVPIYVGPRASLVVMKDKSPKFGEVAHSKHNKGSDDLKMEGPRFVTRNRLDNVVSKVEIGTPAVLLAQMLSEDALLDMKRKDQFVHAFTQQSDAGMKEVRNILEYHCIALWQSSRHSSDSTLRLVSPVMARARCCVVFVLSARGK